jgi:two-component system C4-dicarboxylate transport sensor histidine kinase DctB
VLVNELLEDKVEQRTLELRVMQAELMQKNRTTALGNMAATIVHELSQPLAAINSSVAAAQAKVANENWQGASESIQRLNPLSKKMNNVIGLLKSYSYEDESLVEEVEFADLVQQAIDVLHDRFQTEKITIKYENSYSEARVKVNPIKIDLAISNLLKNAMDAIESQDNAIIEITVEKSIEPEKKTTFVMVSVQDNGNGVDQAILDKLFNPYFTTKEVGRGMGLGLSITGEVIQEHDGSIDVKNTKKGACFSFALPVVGEKSLKNNA